MAMITMDQAARAYTAGNARGEGYAPYTDEAGDDTIDEAVSCAEEDGWEVELRCDGGLVVLRNGDGELLGIGGAADGAGAWAVPLVTRAQVEALRDEAAVAGDLEMVAICKGALGGDEDDMARTVYAICNGQG